MFLECAKFMECMPCKKARKKPLLSERPNYQQNLLCIEIKNNGIEITCLITRNI